MPWTPRIADETQPMYLAIADAIAGDAETGRLAAGTRMPTHRALAKTLGIDVTTVTRAYAEARRRGLIVGHVGRGTYVRGARSPALSLAPGAVVDLTVNLPPEPSDVCDDAMRDALAELGRTPAIAALLAYPPLGGSAEHREAGREWCAERGMTASAERVRVVGGAQQAVAAVLSAHCEPGDTVVTESLTYPGFLAAARMLRLRVVGVPIDHDGILPDALAHACRTQRPKMLLTTPTLQNPTTSIMSVARRRRVAGVLADRGVLLLEDDVYGPLLPHAPRPLAAFIPEQAYYVSTLSKTITPALRTAFLVAPTAGHSARLISHVAATGGLAPLMSEIAARWIRSGLAAKIVADRRREAHARQTELHHTLGRPVASGPSYALHYWLELPPQWDRASDFVETLRSRGVLVASGHAFSVDAGADARAVRVSLGSAPDRAALSIALERIATTLQEDPQPPRPAR